MPSFIAQTPMTEPGPLPAGLSALGTQAAARVDAVQNLLVHEASLGLYGLTAEDFPGADRRTLPVRDRLERLAARAPIRLDGPRDPRDRGYGTCRDYALMTCGLLREAGLPARVRCGFATYFISNRFSDHWICEYLPAGESDWLRVDAQMDPPHRETLGIAFDPLDMPRDAFLTAEEAWTLRARGGAAPTEFGHGKTVGDGFLWVNLARDHLALQGREISDWDRWREAGMLDRPLDPTEWAECERLAREISALAAGDTVAPIDRPPFWMP